jgi:hypothetical protein
MAAGKPVDGTTPVQVVANLKVLAAATEKAVAWLRSSIGAAGVSAELDATLKDMSVFALLGRYYAGKLCGAMGIALYNATKDSAHRAQAVSCLQEGVTHWKAYTALAAQQYTYPQLLARVALLDIVGFTANVEADVQIAQDA